MANNRIFSQQFENICNGITKRPGMYTGGSSNYQAVTAYINGMDVMCNGLVGFYQWLVVKIGVRYNVVWDAFVLDLSDDPIPFPPKSPEDNKRAIQFIGEVLAEFFEYRDRHSIDVIFTEYANWLNEQK